MSDQEVILLREFELEGIDATAISYRGAIGDFLEQEAIFEQSFKKVFVAITNNQYTLIPSALFDIEDVASYYAFNLPVENSIRLMVDHIDALGIDFVYSIHQEILQKLNQRFGKNGFEVKHTSSYVLPLLTRMHQARGAKNTCYINISSKSVQLTCLKGVDFLLHNSFPYKTDEDLLYYIVNASHQVGFNLEQDEYVLYGDVGEKDKKYQLLEPYFTKLSFGQRPANKMYCTALDKIASNQHFSLFCIK